MDSSAITAYPRHHSFHAHRPVRAQVSVPGETTYKPIVPINSHNRFQYQYNSDPTLLDGRSSRASDIDDASGGRRSAQDQYPQSEEDENNTKQARKEKKKKLKRLRSFVHVFFGGLHKKHSFHVSGVADVDHPDKDIIATTRYRQKNERDGMSSSFKSSIESGANTTSNNNTSTGKVVLSRLPRSPDIPGLCGLQNHGNTCFMNAVLQCLSNTDQLAEYFVTDQYKNDINRQKHKARISFGTCGEVTEQFALLLKCLWNGQYDPRVTAQFKEVVGRHSSQYQGTSQHDAQEFFLWLLDNVHEDLNQAGRKKYRPIKDGVGRPDEEVAAETLISHMKSNNSFIQNLFQGQFRSAIICPSCNTRSATFDPYVCVSLPLPQQESRPVYVTMVYRSTGRTNKVYGVNMNVDGTIRDLRNNLAEICGVTRHHLVLTDLTPSGFNRTFYDDQHISVISGGDLIFGFECPPYRGNNPEAFTQNNPSGSKELMLILVVNKFGQTQFGKRFGPPLILRIWRDLTHSQFQSVVLKAMSSYLREGVKLTDVCRTGVLFRCRVMDGLPGRCILPTEVDHPFYSPSVDKASHVSMLYGGPAHIKIVAEWEPETKASVFGVVPDEVPEPDDSVTKLRQLYEQPPQATLDDALRMYTREEILNREDSWYCVHCKHQQKDATKKITLWTLPDVLVVHLKRFRQVGYNRTKLNTLVQFPITGLDMTPYLAPRNRPSSATLERKRSAAKMKGVKTLPSKTVHFEDETVEEKSKKGVNRSASSTSTNSSKFHFPWKRSKKEKTPPPSASHSTRTKSPEVSYSNCESPCSVRSAPSTIGHSTHSPPPQEFSRQSSHSLDHSRLDNVYDLYAICNHHGSMSRGHYTAYCRNPADGNWYTFDDMSIHQISADELVTAGAYMLFYVRQSLIAQSPLSSSESSTSSSSSNHWIYHIPQFRLDLGSLGSSSDDAQAPNNINDMKPMRARLGSANSAVSAPPLAGIRGVSPHSSAHDNDSDVFSPPNRHHAIETQSAVNFPSSSFAHQHSHPPPSAHQHYPSSPSYRPFPNPPNYQMAVNQALASPHHNRITTSGRHASLRLARDKTQHSHSTSAEGTEEAREPALRRAGSLHAPRRHAVKRTNTDDDHTPQYFDFPPNPYFASNKGMVMPSRSIPNMSEMESNRASGEYAHLLPQTVVPSRSIPNMTAGEMTPGPPRTARTFSDDPALHFMTPQLQHQRNFGRPGFSMSQNMGGAESCV